MRIIINTISKVKNQKSKKLLFLFETKNDFDKKNNYDTEFNKEVLFLLKIKYNNRYIIKEVNTL